MLKIQSDILRPAHLNNRQNINGRWACPAGRAGVDFTNVKFDCFTAKNTSALLILWAKLSTCQISPLRLLIIGEFPPHQMLGREWEPPNTCSSSFPDPESKKWTNYIQTCFWLELISFINSNQTADWLGGREGNLTFIEKRKQWLAGEYETTTTAQIIFYYYQF